ncbi:phage adaptor protein, partial [Herbiconiux daphne]
MAVISNYGELKNAVTQYLDRTDAKAIINVPMFISFAESDLYQILDIPQDEGAATISVPTAGAGIAIPDECETIKALMVNGEVATRVQIETMSKLPQDGIKPTV